MKGFEIYITGASIVIWWSGN